MAYQVLARKWRPNRFSELVGQEHVVTAISNALDNNRLHHAYLFTGTRGVGKTTIARIFSKSLNCETGLSANPCGKCHTCLDIENGSFVDLLEIDAASRTKVEDTRELLDNVQYKPTRGQFKVYLIDEVHMLSKHSFNALLKTLEEPPPHVKFLLATTDPQKLPVTILSRCLQFNLKALSRDQITQQLSYILKEENIFSEPQALSQLARAAQGSMRDALSLTDQAIAQGDGKVSNVIVTDMLGLMDKGQIIKLLHTVFSNEPAQVMAQIETMSQQSVNYEQVLSELMSLLHQVALTQFVPEACKLETVAARAVYQLAKMMPPEQVQLAYQIALQGKKDISHAADARIGLEMTLLRMLAFNPSPISLTIDETNSLTTKASTSSIPIHSDTGEKKTVEKAEFNGNEIEQTLVEQQSDIIRQANSLVGTQARGSERSNANDLHQEIQATQVDNVAQNPVDIDFQKNHENQQNYENSDVYHQEYFEQQSNLADFHADNTVQNSDTNEVNNLPTAEQQISPSELSHNDISVQANSLSATESLIALKDRLSKLEVASDEEEKKEVKSTDDFLPSRFKPQSNNIIEDSAVIEKSQDISEQEIDAQKQIGTQFTDSENSETQFNPSNEIIPIESDSDSHIDLSEQAVSPDVLADEDAKSQASIDSDYAEQQHNQDTPPWLPETAANSQSITDSEQVAVNDEEIQEEFDPMAHLNEPVEVNVDFDVPAFLENGEKVIHSSQLDTWSQLIEQMQVTALTKQLALHSSYEKNDNLVTLKLLDSKLHLDTVTARSQLQQALSELFQQQIELRIEHCQPISTPFAVQQTINQVRMQHAKNVAETNPEINRIKNIFSAQVIESSIKPR
ncbi:MULTISPECIES: DNA polymerase III subunit gamma/tau [Aliiglaciecola]|uniref:DNA polymerase III subunit gamma/tau n=1 Tax=Aliiglaciecola TaxID=1406885 RepID=UPI001C09F15A|nr:MULTISPECIES: DNA polymerase III subunit gamma/tau [Aliiglaciecola]MBU2877049.1 DNA polymerase III subunit gamma/tau [Aliiglaciecola lipolytica]MDO6712256.1 DNA polymerase III subunit gamma/tau [Aliiglaciecola sp. 2_MG-2023]MDO6753338.1 DNA polymerase III subunit gamma/tau [Aliiglaciecola sp. 1_MG-2023]